MEFIIAFLIIIIIILSFYLFLLKREIKKTAKNLENIEKYNSNTLLNKEFDDRSLNELKAQINTLLKSINEKEIDINIKNESLQKMITNIAHDLRTPLTSAIGYIDLIKSEEINFQEKMKYITIIEERLNKLSELITNFFDFSKSNRNIDFNCDETKIELQTNKSLLIRIFDNLIINAYKHSKNDLKINVKKINSKVQCEFINRIEDLSLDINSIFDEFYTADISRTKGNTGLGLAIVKEFVQLLNGSILAEKQDNVLKITIIL